MYASSSDGEEDDGMDYGAVAAGGHEKRASALNVEDDDMDPTYAPVRVHNVATLSKLGFLHAGWDYIAGSPSLSCFRSVIPHFSFRIIFAPTVVTLFFFLPIPLDLLRSALALALCVFISVA